MSREPRSASTAVTSLSDVGAFGVDDVQALLATAQAAAAERNLRVVVAIVDRGGNLLGLLRHPDAFLTSTEIAVAKAFTAANFGESTADLAERLPAETRFEIGRVDPRLVFIRGGLSISRGARIVGGLGVSGATSQQDEEVAASALEALAAETGSRS